MGYYGELVRLFPVKLQHYTWHKKTLNMKLRNDATLSSKDCLFQKASLVGLYTLEKYHADLK